MSVENIFLNKFLHRRLSPRQSIWYYSLRLEHPVAGVAEARRNIAVVVEPFVDRCGPRLHVGMDRDRARDPLGDGQQADEADVRDAGRCL